MKPQQTLVFGDSITYGIWDTEGGWVARIRKHFDKEAALANFAVEHRFYNLGIPSDKSDGVAGRLEQEIKPRLNNDGTWSVLVAIGVNDSLVDDRKPDRKAEDYVQNIGRIAGIVSKYTDTVYFVGLMPVVEKQTNPISWNDHVRYTNDRIKEFDQALKAFCESRSYKYIHLFGEIIKQPNFEKLYADGLHPNNEGHKLMSQTILKAIQ